MLNERAVAFTYREYTKDPLSVDEIRDVLDKLGMSPREVLRKRDAAKHDISASLDDEGLIAAMAVHPRLLQRPIAILGDKAELGRPVENLHRLL